MRPSVAPRESEKHCNQSQFRDSDEVRGTAHKTYNKANRRELKAQAWFISRERLSFRPRTFTTIQSSRRKRTSAFSASATIRRDTVTTTLSKLPLPAKWM